MPLSEEDRKCLAELSKMTDEDIDYSDIPKLTKEEFADLNRHACVNRNSLKPLQANSVDISVAI